MVGWPRRNYRASTCPLSAPHDSSLRYHIQFHRDYLAGAFKAVSRNHLVTMLDRSLTIPEIEPGINLLWAPPRSTAFHHLALSILHDVDGKGVWIDARDTASTTVLHDLATTRTLRRLRVTRSWTAYQHHQLVRQLPGVVDTRTDLLLLPADSSLYEDDDVPSPEDCQYLTATLAVLQELSRVCDMSVLVSVPRLRFRLTPHLR